MRVVDAGPIEQTLRIPQASALVLGVRLTHGGAPRNLTADTVYFTVKAGVSTVGAVIYGVKNEPGDHSAPLQGETEFVIGVNTFSNYRGSGPYGLVYEVRVNDTPYLQGVLWLAPVVGRA